MVALSTIDSTSKIDSNLKLELLAFESKRDFYTETYRSTLQTYTISY